MDHQARKTYTFNQQKAEAIRCYKRLEELVAAVPISQLKFTGAETKVLETVTLSFYDMAQIRRANVTRRGSD